MSFRVRLAFVTLLCLIAITQSSCARSARTVRMASAPAASRGHSARTTDSADRIRDAIRTLKDRAASKPADVVDAQRDAQLGAVGTQGGGVSKGVGTSGALSVESRYPAPPQGSPDAGAVGLSDRAADAASRATRHIWAVIIIACVVGLLFAAFVRRRSAHHIG